MTAKLAEPLRYHGGNAYLAPWMHEHYPPWGSYTHRATAFMGGWQEGWSAPYDGISESVNDVDGELVHFFETLRDAGDSLVRHLALQPFAQEDFEAARNRLLYRRQYDDVVFGHLERAADFFIVMRQSRQGLGKDFATPTRRVRRGMNEQVSAYLSAVDGLGDVVERLRRVEIRNLDFRKFVTQYDHRLCFHVWDPPYLACDEDGTPIRVTTTDYACELTIDDHVALLDLAATIKGKFMLQGYPSKLYERYARQCGWRVVSREVDAKSSSAKKKGKRTETLWMNY